MALWEQDASSAEGIQQRSGCASAAPSVPCASLRQKDFCCPSPDICLGAGTLHCPALPTHPSEARLLYSGTPQPKRVCFLFLEALLRSEQRALLLPAVLAWQLPALGCLQPFLCSTGANTVIPAASPKPWFCVCLLGWGLCLSRVWDGVDVVQGLSGGQIAISSSGIFW